MNWSIGLSPGLEKLQQTVGTDGTAADDQIFILFAICQFLLC